jgi:hypothetical protein
MHVRDSRSTRLAGVVELQRCKPSGRYRFHEATV